LPVEVHGGLTSRQRASDGGMWFGFDTAHCMDYVEVGGNGDTGEEPGRVWTVDDVAAEAEILAGQLADRVKERKHEL
jgi:hypothetical protein